MLRDGGGGRRAFGDAYGNWYLDSGVGLDSRDLFSEVVVLGRGICVQGSTVTFLTYVLAAAMIDIWSSKTCKQALVSVRQ